MSRSGGGATYRGNVICANATRRICTGTAPNSAHCGCSRFWPTMENSASGVGLQPVRASKRITPAAWPHFRLQAGQINIQKVGVERELVPGFRGCSHRGILRYVARAAAMILMWARRRPQT